MRSSRSKLSGLGEDGPSNGAAPYVQLLAWGEGLVRAEAVSNAYLNPAFALKVEAYDEMQEIGWNMPTHGEDEEPDHGSANFWINSESREADRLAWMAVRSLREVYGCLHPSFLNLAGVDEEPSEPAEPAASDDEEQVVFPADRDDLHKRVICAISHWLMTDEVNVDNDGDVPIRVGRSLFSSCGCSRTSRRSTSSPRS